MHKAIETRLEIKKIQEKLEDDLWLERKWACYRIGQFENPKILRQFVPKLLEMMEDPHQDVRREALDSLGVIPIELFSSIHKEQILLYLVDPNGTVQLGALKLLNRIWPNRFYNKSIRQIYKSLYDTEKKTLFEKLCHILFTDKTDRAINAMLALGDLDLPEVPSILLQFAERVAHNVQERIPLSPRKLAEGEIEAYSGYFFQILVNSIGNALEPYPLNLESLVQLFQQEKSDRMRRVFAEILRSRTLSSMFAPFIVTMLDDKSGEIVEIAVLLAQKLSSPSLILPLIEHIPLNNAYLTGLIVSALIAIEPLRFAQVLPERWMEVYHYLTQDERDQIFPNLLSCLGLPATQKQSHAELVLSQYPQEEYLSQLYQLMRSGNASITTAVVHILKAWKFESTLYALFDILLECDFSLEFEVLEAIDKISGHRLNSKTVHAMLKSLNPQERAYISHAIKNRLPILAEIESEGIPGLQNLGKELDNKRRNNASTYSEASKWQQFPSKILAYFAYLVHPANEIALIHLILHPNSYIQKGAISTLGELQSARAIPILMALYKFPLIVIREIIEEIFETTTKIGHFSLIDPLISCFRFRNTLIDRKIVESLKFFNAEWVSNALNEHAHDDEWHIRYGVAFSFGFLKYWQDLPTLLRLSHDPVVAVKRIATYALGEIRLKSSLIRLKDLYNDKDPEIKLAALMSIGKFQEKHSFDIIINAVTDSDRKVRQTAAILLGQLGDPQAVPHLNTILLEPNSGVRTSAIQALQKIGSRPAVAALVEALWNADPHIHAALLNSINALLAQNPSITLPILHREYRSRILPIPSHFNLFEVLPSLTGTRLFQFLSLDFGDLIHSWLTTGNRLALQLLERFGMETVPYIDRALDGDVSLYLNDNIIALRTLREFLWSQNTIPSRSSDIFYLL